MKNEAKDFFAAQNANLKAFPPVHDWQLEEVYDHFVETGEMKIPTGADLYWDDVSAGVYTIMQWNGLYLNIIP